MAATRCLRMKGRELSATGGALDVVGNISATTVEESRERLRRGPREKTTWMKVTFL